jgi:SAM-dependent methyltransferase
MAPWWLKRLFYWTLRAPMWINGRVYRWWRQPADAICVHLGPGKGRYIPGWLNLDANLLTARIDLWVNLMDPMPFRDNSVALFYSHHVVEHLPDRHLHAHFREMFRALVPGGGIRIGGPDTGAACERYLAGDLELFSTYPTPRGSIGGRLANFIFCNGEHLTALSESYLRELAEAAGFVDIRRMLPCRESGLVGREVLDLEYENDFVNPHTVIIEARKPR